MKRFILILLVVLLPLMVVSETFKFGQTVRINWNVLDPATGTPVSATSGVELRLYHSNQTQQGTDIAMTEDSTGRYSYLWTIPTDVEDVYYATFTYAYSGVDYWYTGYSYSVVSDSVIVDISNALTLVDSIIVMLLSTDIQAYQVFDSFGTAGYYITMGDSALYDVGSTALDSVNNAIADANKVNFQGTANSLDSAVVSNLLHRIVFGQAVGSGSDSTTLAQRASTWNYLLTSSYPTNFADLTISASTGYVSLASTNWATSTAQTTMQTSINNLNDFDYTTEQVTVGTNNDKITGYATSTAQTTMQTSIDNLNDFDPTTDSVLLANRGQLSAQVSDSTYDKFNEGTNEDVFKATGFASPTNVSDAHSTTDGLLTSLGTQISNIEDTVNATLDTAQLYLDQAISTVTGGTGAWSTSEKDVMVARADSLIADLRRVGFSWGNFKADVSNLDAAVSTRATPSNVTDAHSATDAGIAALDFATQAEVVSEHTTTKNLIISSHSATDSDIGALNNFNPLSDSVLLKNIAQVADEISDTLQSTDRFLYFLSSYWGVIPGDTTVYYPNDGTAIKDSVVIYNLSGTRKLKVIFKHSNSNTVMDSTIILWGPTD